MLCFNYNSLSINLIAFVVSIFFTFCIYCITSKPCVDLELVCGNNNFNSSESLITEEQLCYHNNQKFSNVEIINSEEWKVKIPKIDLEARISEGVDSNTLNSFVGHFTETGLWDGNIGLAAHNRGYNVNYFSRLKELEAGDEIIYMYQGKIRKYSVSVVQVIEETNWMYLENSVDNKITLITCVEDMPELRRCVQAIEIKED